MAARQFQVVEDDSPQPASTAVQNAAVGMLTLSLKALSQRALVAIDNLFTLLTVASAFWLWMSIPEPNSNQLIGLGLYAVFVLAANWIVRRTHDA